jgi:hypothetical protein
MNDLVFIGIILAFFALAALFVRACDRIIGADIDAIAEPLAGVVAGTSDTGKVAA